MKRIATAKMLFAQGSEIAQSLPAFSAVLLPDQHVLECRIHRAGAPSLAVAPCLTRGSADGGDQTDRLPTRLPGLKQH